MDIFELDPQAVKFLQDQGFNLLERANLIYATYLFPNCDTPPSLEWKDLTTGVHLLLDDFDGRESEVRNILSRVISFLQFLRLSEVCSLVKLLKTTHRVVTSGMNSVLLITTPWRLPSVTSTVT